jgi:hypothetical protein
LFDLFDVDWDRLEQPHVERFLAEAGEEGVTWEAKGGSETGEIPRPESIRKAACGLANQAGGYLIVGATRAEGKWQLDGIPRPASEPALWLGQILRGLQPVPRFDVLGPFDVGDEKVALVARIDAVVIPPCMTPQGRIYERVSGETLPVVDPELLDRLFRRGKHARSQAEQFARLAAGEAISLPMWPQDRSVSICVGLASVGRETDDIASRLFTAQMYELLKARIWEFYGDGQPDEIFVRPTQDSYVARAESPRNEHWNGADVVGVYRSCCFIRAKWDGSVAAGLWSADEFEPGFMDIEPTITKCWERAAEIVEQLGGYGSAYLTVHVEVAKSNKEELFLEGVRVAGRPPPRAMIYASTPGQFTMGRLLDRIEPDESVVNSLGRELLRAGGERADEPG